MRDTSWEPIHWATLPSELPEYFTHKQIATLREYVYKQARERPEDEHRRTLNIMEVDPRLKR